MVSVAIVILNYNGIHYLKKFLPFVVKYSNNCEIYVADNASTDGSAQYIRENFYKVKLILLSKNFGFCEGYNRALKQIDSDYYLLLNSDVEITPGWIEPMVRLFQKDPTVAVVQPKILSFHNRQYFEYAGAAGGYIDRFGYPFCRGRLFETLEKDEGQYDEIQEIFWASGACVLIRSDVFHQFGGLDVNFFAHMEEIDLCWRLKNAGFKVMYCPHSKVYHVGGGTLPKNNPKKVFFNFRNSLFVLVKNLPGKQLFYKITMRLILDFPAALMYLFKGYPANFLMILKAHIGFYRQLSQYLKERKGPFKDPLNLGGYYSGSVLLKYYIKKVKVFTRL